jgi:hypothetical protein
MISISTLHHQLQQLSSHTITLSFETHITTFIAIDLCGYRWDPGDFTSLYQVIHLISQMREEFDEINEGRTIPDSMDLM